MVKWLMQEYEIPEVKSVIDACRSLRADAVALEMADRTIVVAMNAYDGTHAVACCEPGAHLPSIARGLQVQLYRRACHDSPTEFLPVSVVSKALSRWERQIAIVFGRQYAARLVSDAVRSQDWVRVTIYDLEAIRRQLSASIGECIELNAEK
jgi:hypothetical protein